MDVDVVLMCSAHGIQKWAGHLCCVHCGRLYEQETLPEACSCGAAFATALSGDLEAVLRMTYDKTLPVKRICKRCFKHFSKKGGRVPVETRKPS